MRLVSLVSVVTVAAFAATASAAEVTVEMLNRDKATNTTNVFKPALVRVNKGDTVTWKATNPGHNAAFMPPAARYSPLSVRYAMLDRNPVSSAR